MEMGLITISTITIAPYCYHKNVSRWKNIVYLSSGRDTRDGFTSHLHQKFRKAKIKTYMQNPDEAVDELLPESLDDEMKNSRFLVVVFSESFASSERCLDELEQIIRHRRDDNVRPIFYKVEPSELRHCDGKTGEYLAAHERKYGKDSEKITRWKTAIEHLGGIKGLRVGSCRTEEQIIAEFVEKIARAAFDKFRLAKRAITGRLKPEITLRPS